MDIKGESIQNGEPTPEHPVEIENKTNILLAIEILKKLKSKVTLVKVDDENNSEKEYRLPFLMDIEKQAIETVLSELEKKDKEYEELTEASKELCKTVNLMKKVINEMAEQLAGLAIFDIEKDEPLVLGDKEEVKEYFTKKSEKEGIKDEQSR